MEFYHAVNRYFSITKNSFNNDFYTQIYFLNKMKEYSEDSTNECIILLFINIAKEFLKLHFTPIEGGRKHSFTVYQIPLLETDGSKEYRKIIWEWLFELCKTPEYKEKVYQVLYGYHGCAEEVSAPIAQYDMTYIQSIMETYFSPSKLKNCLLAKHLSKNIACDSVPNQSLFANYFEGSQFKLYSILKGPSYGKGIGHVENEKIKRKSIEEYVLSCNLSLFKDIIDLCTDINVLDGHSKWKISEGLAMAFEILYSKHNYYVDAIKYYIECDTPCDLNACCLIQPLFSLISEDEVLKLITTYQYNQENAWLYAYYHELPDEKIRQKHVEGLYDFLSQSTDKDIKSSPMRDLDFLDKYRTLDEDVFIKGCEIILNKHEYSMFIVDIYFGLLFNKYHNTPQELISRFKLNLELLCEIYSAILLYHNHDYDGEFLREIYLACPSVLDTYIDVLVDESKRVKGHNSLSNCFWNLPNFIEIYNKIFEQIVNSFVFPEISVPIFLENILLPVENAQALLEKQDAWIRQCIGVFSNDEIKMKCLFAVISKLNTDKKIEYITLYCKINSSFDDFEKISILPTSYSWSGSAIPMYSDWIEFLQQLLPNFIGLKWIQHKNYVEERISSLKERIKAVEIDEMLRG